MTNITGTWRNDSELLAAVAAGDPGAWRTVMERYDGAVRGTLASFRFDQATADDVAQAVWVKLYENAHKIRDARRLGGWLRTTTRRTAIEITRQRKRLTLVDDFTGFPQLATEEPEIGLEADERTALCRGFRALSHDAQQLLSLVFADDPLPYAEIAEELERPVGSLGPTRARALRQLRANYETALVSRSRSTPPQAA